MKPQDLLDLIPEDADPLASLDKHIESLSCSLSAAEKLAALNRCAELLARSPLGSIDVYAPAISDKIGVTKATLTAAVKKARSQMIPLSSTSPTENVEVTDSDRHAAKEILESLLIEDRFVAAMETLGVVGERPNLILLLLTIVSRLLKKPISVVLKSASSTGKSFLMNTVLSTLPATEYTVFTAASAKALFFRQDSLAHKVLAFMERPGVEGSDYQIRVLQSEGKLTYSIAEKDPDTGKIVTNDREVAGPVAYIETTTEPVLHDENETRLFSASLDESPEATAQIVAEQARRAAGNTVDEAAVLALWHAVHIELKPVMVVIPFAQQIARHFPHRVVRVRRDFPRFLSLIEASALLYQFQRQRDDRGLIVATLDDYVLARSIAIPLLESAMLGATEKTRKLVAAARELANVENASAPQEVKITVTKLAKCLRGGGWSRPTVARHLKAAERAGYVDVVVTRRGQESEYRLAFMEAISLALPTAEQLMEEDGVVQPAQGSSNGDEQVNPRDSNDLVEADQPRQGGRGQAPLFDDEPIPYGDPDFA